MSGNRGQRGMGDRGGRGGGGRGFDNRGGGGGRGRGFDDRGGRGGGRGGGGFRGPIGPTIFMENTPAQLPTRLTDNSQNALIASFGTVAKTHGPERPLRPGFGTLGVAITLRANFFPVRLPSSPQTLYDYSVKVSPSQTPNAIVRRLFELLERDPIVQPHVAHLAHDYSQRIVSRQLLPEPLKVRIPFHDEDETGPNPNAKIYTLTITLYKTLEPQILKKYLDGDLSLIDFDIQPHISAYNLISQRHAATTGRRTGKNIPKYFFDSGEKNNLSPGVFAWQGFSTSVRPVFKQLMINVNICVSAFVLPGNLADALMEFNRNSQGAMPSLPNRMTESIKIRTIHLGYKKSLKAIGTQSARNCRFSCEEFNDSNMSVEKYFSKKYSIKLQYPVELPVVDIGSQKRPVWIPAELCEILPGCQLKGKLNETETANMIRYACKVPRINAETIVSRGLPTLGLSPAAQSLNEFGLSIAADMATIPGRELPPPGLKYRSGNTRPNAGSWNILDVKFQRGAVVTFWWVLVVKDGKGIIQGPQDPNLIGLVDGFAAKLSKSGMTVPPGKPRLLPVVLERKRTDTIRAADLDTIRQKLKTTMQEKGKPTFVLVLLENRDNYIYPGIKRIGDVELGIHTVHMQLSKALGDERKQDQYFSNVALKVNTKLGGLNHLLDDRATSWLRKKKTMMVGIDVTHPGPGSKPGTPSIAAVVASVDDSFVQFPGSIRIQGSRNEMLHELSEMLRERLHVYEKKNKTLPERIFVYRDGVSEGQFDQTVIQLELPQILDAFEKMNTKDRKVTYRPQLAIIVCGKRHHAKFFPTNSQFADRNGNTRPGTVVDRGVTGVFDFDFYLQAHAGLQGHVKSTHYTVVYDEMGLTADEIQQGTHDASYLYARATKAVSLIPAAYYADLACERGRCYLNDFLVTDDKLSLSKYTRLSRLEQDQERARVFDAAKRHWGGGLNPDLRETMFYI